MDQFNALSLGRKLILAAGVLLIIDTFLAWQKVEVKIGGLSAVSASQNAWHGFWGVLLGLMTIALVAWVAARAFGVTLPDAVPDGLTTLALGALILLFAVLKTLTDDYSHWPSYVGIVLAAIIAAGAWMAFKESGEAMPQLAGRASSTPSSSSTPPPAAPPEEPAGTDPV